ncbi:hypothetical protein, partial [Klebsiella pneumoniae]|uniref:hypothetical protein n=1 Tax=Klebsiella pneumoniae TaxID=573 RepID=UPI001D0DB9CC
SDTFAMKDPAFFFFLIFKEHHPLSCRGRGFDFVRGPAEPAPWRRITRLSPFAGAETSTVAIIRPG